MTRTLRILFLGRPAREKILVLLLLIVLAALWLSSFSGRASTFLADSRRMTGELKDQSNWLANRSRIEANAREQASRLDPSQTLDSPRLTAAVDSLAQDAGLSISIAPAQDQPPSGNFSIHTLDCTITKVGWDALCDFYSKLEARAPYISIEQMSVNADRGNPALLNVSLRVSSVEIAGH